MPSQKLEFQGHSGDFLAARLDTPAAGPRAYAIFAHCFTCGKDIVAASRISQALVERGFAVLRFDFTGLGMSEGEFANTNFSSNVEDLVKAADFLRDHQAAPTLLIGHSLGGAAVLAAAQSIEEVTAVVTIGAPSDPEHVKKQFGHKVDDIREQGEAEVALAGRPFRIQAQFLDDIESTRLQRCVEKLGRALLVMHSPVDATVDVENARQIYEAARHPKSFVSLDDADHLLSKRADAEYTAAVLATWAQRYLPDAEVHEPQALDEAIVEVAETGAGKFANQVRAGRHSLPADEPKRLGGTDTGPTPYDYLLAGLGACTSMTLRMYAERKQLALDKVSVRLSQNKVHADDCADCESSEGQITEIQREIRLDGALSEEERDKLLEIADKCPVHRTLEQEIKIRSRLTD
ncbi:MAG: bifunctional alpha/beta hydrolase/OsmC family protein [Salinisphaeraceae bacterium]|nr:bifunctional alpha/beta hydrolase/OsmC family protein [Salinisphaeraceae bacterium]